MSRFAKLAVLFVFVLTLQALAYAADDDDPAEIVAAERIERNRPRKPSDNDTLTSKDHPTKPELDGPSSRIQAIGGGGQKTVQVKGYTRKDGTYVPAHTRSAPRR